MYIDLRERLSQLNTTTQENISGNRVVKAFAREEFEIAKFTEKNVNYAVANKKRPSSGLTTSLIWRPSLKASTLC
ncbi:ABC transporter transmembrane domain-containing protein [Paenibacillus rhizoplanae]